jgi:hypothetical protein
MVNFDRQLAATAYNYMIHDPADPAVDYSYTRLKETLGQQWLALNTVIDFELDHDGSHAYATSADMFADVDENKHLWVLKTDVAGLPEDHPMLGQVPVWLQRQGFDIWNDVFRGVHDIMGHFGERNSFGPFGEERAWLAHRETMPVGAYLALWCETRGQNVWTNFWSDHHTRPLRDRPFAVQKAGVVSLDLV